MTEDDILRAVCKPLEWVPYFPLGTQGKYGNGLFNYEIKEGGSESFWWRQAGSGTWYQPEHDTSFAAAQAAAEADYRQRISSALRLDALAGLVTAAGGVSDQDAKPEYAGRYSELRRKIGVLTAALAAFRSQP